MNRQKGVIAILYLWIAGGIAVTIVGLGIAVRVQTSRLESCKEAHAQFVAVVKAEGEAAAKEAARVNLVNQKAKEVADSEYAKTKGDLASAYAAYRKLRQSGSSGGGLSRQPTFTPSAERTCFDSAKFVRSVGDFEAGLFDSFRSLEDGAIKITERGDTALVGLAASMKWAESLSK